MASRSSLQNPLDRKTPSNPRYSDVGPRLNTGKTVNQVEILSNQSISRKRGELFRRIKPSTIAKLIEELGTSESIYDLGVGYDVDPIMEEDDEETKSVYSMAPSMAGSVVTVATA
jgi:hypothetical protein